MVVSRVPSDSYLKIQHIEFHRRQLVWNFTKIFYQKMNKNEGWPDVVFN